MLFILTRFTSASSSCLSSGFLSGNMAQFGSFQLCVSRWQSRSSFETRWNISPSFLGRPWECCKPPPAQDGLPGMEVAMVSAEMWLLDCSENCIHTRTSSPWKRLAVGKCLPGRAKTHGDSSGIIVLFSRDWNIHLWNLLKCFWGWCCWGVSRERRYTHI